MATRADDAQRDCECPSWQVAAAGEAFAAAQIARCGWDVSTQYASNPPEYYQVAVDSDRVLRMSVTGSKDRSWGLTQNYRQLVCVRQWTSGPFSSTAKLRSTA